MAGRKQFDLLLGSEKSCVRACLHLESIKRCEDGCDLQEEYEEFAKLWREGFVRLKAATSRGKTKLWGDRLEREVRTNPGLQYIRQFRNAVTYSKVVTIEVPAFLSIGSASQPGLIEAPLVPGMYASIRGNTVVRMQPDGRIFAEPIADVEIVDGKLCQSSDYGSVIQSKRYLRLLPVENRGVTYVPPNFKVTHEEHAVVVGEFALEWLSERLATAKQKLGGD